MLALRRLRQRHVELQRHPISVSWPAVVKRVLRRRGEVHGGATVTKEVRRDAQLEPGASRPRTSPWRGPTPSTPCMESEPEE
eukprot:scaffold1627_cov238-Pinguiococcus_pyrenoidosus.AAC.9